MLIRRVTVILRHNTSMPGDAQLALREWQSLMGSHGQPLNEIGLASVLPASAVAGGPRLATAFEWVAVTWKGCALSQVVELARRSAFAQEIFVEGADSQALLAALEPGLGAAAAIAMRYDASLIVALAHNYIIESEAALPAEIHTGRLAAVIRSLLEPFVLGRESTTSRKLRAAKKTTLSLSHDLHIYKAKFFPRMVRALINIFGPDGPVFDPYCGSGTALLEASLLGQDATGVDIDPICAMMSRSKVAPFIENRSRIRKALESFRAALLSGEASALFDFPIELEKKIARRDRIDGTSFLDEIMDQAAILSLAVRAGPKTGAAADLIKTIASDAVTKKIRYRFIGVGNGRYTIELIKQPLLERALDKVARAMQLLDVFDDLESVLNIQLGKVVVAQGDARDRKSWPPLPASTFVVTSPPYLPASSGREHYASSRALAFAVLGFGAGEDGYFDNSERAQAAVAPEGAPEADRLMAYLVSDADEDADPQRDAMRFERKAVPTAHYLADIQDFGRGIEGGRLGSLAMVVADQHTFYSHRRGEIEHVVNCASLYGEVMAGAGLRLREEIELQLLKSSASRAKPRSTDDYHEAVLIFDVAPAVEQQVKSKRSKAHQVPESEAA